MGRRAAELAGVLIASLITSFVTGLALSGPNEPVLYVVGALVPLALLLVYALSFRHPTGMSPSEPRKRLQSQVLLVELWVGDERKRAGEQAKERYR
jgi:hypothetical protein